MSMSTHVIGFKPPDEKWQKMKAAWDACKAAEIEPPDEVQRFFEYTEPDPNGVEVKLPLADWSRDGAKGVEVYLDQVSKDVKVIRFYNSW